MVHGVEPTFPESVPSVQAAARHAETRNHELRRHDRAAERGQNHSGERAEAMGAATADRRWHGVGGITARSRA